MTVCGPNFLLSRDFPSNFFSLTTLTTNIQNHNLSSHFPEKAEFEAHPDDNIIHSFSQPQLHRCAPQLPPAQSHLPRPRLHNSTLTFLDIIINLQTNFKSLQSRDYLYSQSCFSHQPSHAMSAGHLASHPVAYSQLLPYPTQGFHRATVSSAPAAHYSLFSTDLLRLNRDDQ